VLALTPLLPEEETADLRNLRMTRQLRSMRAYEHLRGNTHLTLAAIIYHWSNEESSLRPLRRICSRRARGPSVEGFFAPMAPIDPPPFGWMTRAYGRSRLPGETRSRHDPTTGHDDRIGVHAERRRLTTNWGLIRWARRDSASPISRSQRVLRAADTISRDFRVFHQYNW